MSSGSDVFPFSNTPEPSFELALRGYEKRQVDRYVQQVEAEIAALAAEREETYAQIGMLNQHVAQLQAEVANARRFAAPGDANSYRHLGPKVEQILALAEDQAADIRIRAESEFRDREEAIARARAEIDAEARDAARDLELALAARRAEDERAAARRREEVMAEVDAAKAYAEKVRTDIDAVYAAAQ